MKTKAFLALLALVLAMAPGVALADTTYNTLAAGGNGFYNGTGNVDGSFTTDTESAIALSLRGAQRYQGPLAESGNDYTCPSPESCNVEFSVATIGPDVLESFTYSMTVDDITSGKSFSADPTLLPDNTYWKGGKEGPQAYDPLATGFQNSEYLGFSFLGLNWSSNDYVEVTLTASQGPTQAASVNIDFNAPVPEPSVAILLLTMMAPLSLLSRRIRS